MTDKIWTITFQPQGIRVKVPQGTTILEAAISHDIPLEGPCNGKGTCGKCLVKHAGNLNEPSQSEKDKLGTQLDQGWRLACQAKVTGDVDIILPEKLAFQTISGGKSIKYHFEPPIWGFKGVQLPETVLGVAIDIGTTSIVASLVNLRNGKELAVSACLNPQTQYGGDVITRITFAHQQPENVDKLKEAVINGINCLITGMCQEKQLAIKDIYHGVIAGNTTMLHLLTGIDPISLARAPYKPVFLDYQEYKASELGISAAPGAIISLLPSLSAFVGADVLAGLVSIDFGKEQEPSLFIDIGTNGEIVANVNGKLIATSSATGPALEGMNIYHGCRAEDGAISRVKITEAGEVTTEKIGSGKTKGLCGSGLVDLVAELVRTKVVPASGRFAPVEDLPASLGERLINYEGQKAFLVDPEAEIVLTQKDIRQVQLAKAAIAAAIEILFKRLDVSLGNVKKIYIAGAFGYHLKPEALKIIGLLPTGLKEAEIEFVGNTAKEGARLCLISTAALEEIKTLQQRLIPLELSYAPEFQDAYVEQMYFPT